MTDFDMPAVVREVLRAVAEEDPQCFKVNMDSEASISLMFDVSDHPEPDCKYASQLVFDWDIPEPGRLLCYASVGIWNPPAPESGMYTTPYIEICGSGEEEYHQIILRHLSIPASIANDAYAHLNEFIERLLKALKPLSLIYSENHFDNSKEPVRLLNACFNGLIACREGRIQWSQWIQHQAEEGS